MKSFFVNTVFDIRELWHFICIDFINFNHGGSDEKVYVFFGLYFFL